jgi:hypothetical protein
MGVMAGDAPFAEDNAMNRRCSVHQGFHVAVAGETKSQRAFGPELILVVLPVRIMTEGASPQINRTMGNLSREPRPLARMAGETEHVVFC